MIPETQIDWQAFACKFSENPQLAFEELSYILFCNEFNQKTGIFRYYNQPYIETNPILVDNKVIGFQAKYYSDNALSKRKGELIKTIKGATEKYPGINTLYFYINCEFSSSSKRDKLKPAWQIEVEKRAKDFNITIEWRGKSNIEAQLINNQELKSCRNLFFQINSEVQHCWGKLGQHKDDILQNINTTISYDKQLIHLKDNDFDLGGFLKSDQNVLLIDGEAGVGKSALVKQEIINFDDSALSLLAFKITDFDKEYNSYFENIIEPLSLAEIVELYQGNDNRILFIDSVENYFVLEDAQLFEKVFNAFIKAGWKIIFTIRSAYKDSFRDSLLRGVRVQLYTVTQITKDNLITLSETYQFNLPEDDSLIDLLCLPFYLNVYLSLNDLKDEETATLNKVVFEGKVWNEIVRNNSRRKDGMPSRRENSIISITLDMLKRGSYFYSMGNLQDDIEALSELEDAGILSQDSYAKYYFFSHDVFEEIVVNRIFSERYNNAGSVSEIFEEIPTTLRVRRLFRNWLTDYVSTDDHHDIIYKILYDKDVNKYWKQDVIITVITTEKLKDDFLQILNSMCLKDKEMMNKLISLIDTCCCEIIQPESIEKGFLEPYKNTTPVGYTWTVLFNFIENNKEEICWDKESIIMTIDSLNSWTKCCKYFKTENTKTAGRIGLFLYEKVYDEKQLRYTLSRGTISKLQNVLLNSAYMIKQDLEKIFQIVLNEAKGDNDLGSKQSFSDNIPEHYKQLTELVLSDIFHCGNVPYVMPELTIQLMEKLWFSESSKLHYDSSDIDNYFGLDHKYLYNNYFPSSAYKTPLMIILEINENLATEFLIDFCNKAGYCYSQSSLNDNECFNITVFVGDNTVKQIASTRLWNMYRGTSVGPYVLECMLMALERWLLSYAEKEQNENLIQYCRHILNNSQNVLLTSVIVSVAEAYPDKMVDIVCDLIRTKEIFWLDSGRLASESSSSFLCSNETVFGKERVKSNQLPFRQKRLVEIIRSYQMPDALFTKEEFELQKEKVYKAIDDTTKDIETWQTDDKFAYYNMDLRRYSKNETELLDNQGEKISIFMPDFSKDMKARSEQTQKEQELEFRYSNLELWGYYKFRNDENYKKYNQYSLASSVCKDLRKLWEEIESLDNGTSNIQFNNPVLIHRYIKIASYVSTVLLRDYKDAMNEQDRLLCKGIARDLANGFLDTSMYEAESMIDEISVNIVGLIILCDEGDINQANANNPLCLLLKLTLKICSYDSGNNILELIASIMWEQNENMGRRFAYLFSLFADAYEKEVVKKDTPEEYFWQEHLDLLLRGFKTDIDRIEDIDFSELSNNTVFAITNLVSFQTKDAVIVADLTKSITMRISFEDDYRDESYSSLSEYIFSYINWFADLLLFCDSQARRDLMDSFIEQAGKMKNENINRFLEALIMDQQKYQRVEDFWDIWNLLMPRMIQLSNEKDNQLSDYNELSDKDMTISIYLFADTTWNPSVHNSELISEDKAIFFNTFIDESTNSKVILYAIVRLLNTIGRDVYQKFGIDWIYKILSHDAECEWTLYANTLSYMEEYVGNYVNQHRNEFRNNPNLLMKTQTVLSYMIEQGSTIAYFLSESI